LKVYEIDAVSENNDGDDIEDKDREEGASTRSEAVSDEVEMPSWISGGTLQQSAGLYYEVLMISGEESGETVAEERRWA
jgi:hypothetical protein